MRHAWLVLTSWVGAVSTSPRAARSGRQLLVEARRDAYGGFGLFTTQDAHAGATLAEADTAELLSLPTMGTADEDDTASAVACALAPDRASPEFAGWYVAARLALWRLGVSSGGDDWLADLPWERAEIDLPLAWPAAVRESVLADCRDARTQLGWIGGFSEQLAQRILPRVDERDAAAVSLASRLAFALMTSRAMHLATSKRVVVARFLDFANHGARPNARLEDEASADSSVKLVAACFIPAGHEVLLDYGHEPGRPEQRKSATTFFCEYGFVPVDQADTPEGRPLQAALAQRRTLDLR